MSEEQIAFFDRCARHCAGGAPLEVEVALGYAPGCEVTHFVVDYEFFYRCFNTLHDRPDAVLGTPTQTTDTCFANGVRQRVNARGEATLMRKKRVEKSLVVPWPHPTLPWKFAAIKFRAAKEIVLAPDTEVDAVVAVRCKDRQPIALAKQPFWTIDFTRVDEMGVLRHEIEVELNQQAIKRAGGATSAVLIKQLSVVLDALAAAGGQCSGGQ